MKLDYKYSIEKEAHGFSLVEATVVETMKDGKKTGIFKDGQKKSFYGTVYQALQGFLVVASQDVDEISELNKSIGETMDMLKMAKEEIKKEFSIVVKTT